MDHICASVECMDGVKGQDPGVLLGYSELGTVWATEQMKRGGGDDTPQMQA